jgi:hypothetical protein
MWLGVTFFNPLLSFLSLCVLPVDDVIFYSTTVVARVARVVGDWLDRELLPGHSFLGPYLATWVSIDAFIVLSGAVRAQKLERMTNGRIRWRGKMCRYTPTLCVSLSL